MKPEVLEEFVEDRKIFLKAFTKSIFKEFLVANKVNASEKVYEDFYKYTRGYYYYAALAVANLDSCSFCFSALFALILPYP